MCSSKLLAGVAAAVAIFPAMAQQVGDLYDNGRTVRVGQYSTQSSLPAQNEVEPLEVFVLLNYPKQAVHSVGDAIRYTLTRTGWRLADDQNLQPEVQQYMQLVLPESQRSIGTYRVRDVLQTLASSPTWTWKYDYVTRVMWFELSNPALARNAQAVTANTQNTVADSTAPVVTHGTSVHPFHLNQIETVQP